MKSQLVSIRDRLIQSKIMAARSLSYVSLINAGMILFLTLSKLKETGIIHFDIGQYFLVIYIAGILGLIFLGYIEIYVLKGLKQEQRKNFELNPMFMEMKKKIDYLYEKEKINEKKNESSLY